MQAAEHITWKDNSGEAFEDLQLHFCAAAISVNSNQQLWTVEFVTVRTLRLPGGVQRLDCHFEHFYIGDRQVTDAIAPAFSSKCQHSERNQMSSCLAHVNHRDVN